MTLYLFIFVLAVFLGFELINKVPSQLHTPLMSGTNAISGIVIVGAIAGTAAGGTFGTIMGVVALIFATINVVGGYLVTDRMLAAVLLREAPCLDSVLAHAVASGWCAYHRQLILCARRVSINERFLRRCSMLKRACFIGFNALLVL